MRDAEIVNIKYHLYVHADGQNPVVMGKSILYVLCGKGEKLMKMIIDIDEKVLKHSGAEIKKGGEEE